MEHPNTVHPKLNHFRNNVTIDCSIETHGGGADQSFSKQCDINNIMLQYSKTGLLPQQTTVPARYVDNSIIPSLETAFEITNKALEAFSSLPPEVRKLMDNDPTKLEEFISNQENEYILKKHGVLIDKQTEVPDATNQNIVDELKKLQIKTE